MDYLSNVSIRKAAQNFSIHYMTYVRRKLKDNCHIAVATPEFSQFLRLHAVKEGNETSH